MCLKQRAPLCLILFTGLALAAPPLERGDAAQSHRPVPLATNAPPSVDRPGEMQPAVWDDAADAKTPMVWDVAERRSATDPTVWLVIVCGVLFAMIAVEISRQRRSRKAGVET